jgi:hypothetical protein
MASHTQMQPQPKPAATSRPAESEESRARSRRAAEQSEAERLEAARMEAARLEAARLEAARLEAERLRQARLEEKVRLEAEQARLAREQQERESADYACLRDQWEVFQKVRYDAPPKLLPLEEKNELERFQEFLDREFLTSLSRPPLEKTAIARFQLEILSQALDAENAFQSIKQALESTSVFKSIRKLLGASKLLELLRKCIVSISVPELGSPGREAVASACRFLRQEWSSRLNKTAQGLFSVHRCAGKTIMHLGSSAFGSVFITLPQSLEPEALAEEFLSEIQKASSGFMPKDGTLAVVDGDHQSINYQRLFQSNIVVRSVKDDCANLAKNLNEMLEREPPNAANTALHLGLPANPAELENVFEKGGADWDLWHGVAPLWADRARRHGFDTATIASSQQVLESLTTSKNVIIVVAHGDERTIHMPDGSELTAEQILERKDEISANKPIVYLFCCETAEVSNLRNFSQVLLECGAAAVIAPQTKIDAERSVAFFESIVDDKARSDTNSLMNVKTAERRSKYREMEVWLG